MAADTDPRRTRCRRKTQGSDAGAGTPGIAEALQAEIERMQRTHAEESLRMEEFYLNKIAIYADEHAAELAVSQQELVSALLAVRGLRKRVEELETKSTFYKNKIDKLEGKQQE